MAGASYKGNVVSLARGDLSPALDKIKIRPDPYLARQTGEPS
jgi:hypothetical protein